MASQQANRAIYLQITTVRRLWKHTTALKAGKALQRARREAQTAGIAGHRPTGKAAKAPAYRSPFPFPELSLADLN